MAPDSTTSLQPRKRRKSTTPPKPFKDFPLTPHPGGHWCRKIAGKIQYFGRWGRVENGKLVRYEGDEWEAGWKTAQALYNNQPNDFKIGRIKTITRSAANSTAEPSDGVIDLAYICNAFRTNKLRKMEASELGVRMYEEYKTICDVLIEQFGARRLPDDLGARDFEKLREYLAKRYKSARLTNSIIRVRSVFRYAYVAELIDKPIRCLEYRTRDGIFSVPSASVVRRERSCKPKHELTPEECRKLLASAPVQLKAMIYLGLNAGFGAHDCATLPLSTVDFKKCLIVYDRPKTGVSRRCPLWVETVLALRNAIAERPKVKDKDAEGLLFVTTRGRPWLSNGIANPICHAVRNLMRNTGVHRPGFGPYTLRKIFRTIADGTKDMAAIDYIMGHTDSTMGGRYRQSIDDSRLVVVSEHVRAWLFLKDQRRANRGAT